MASSAKAPGSPPGERRGQCVPTQAEVALRLGITRGRVHQLECRALARLRRHPLLRQLAEDLGVLPPEG